MISENLVEVRGWNPPEGPPEKGDFQNYFIFLNGKSYLSCTPYFGSWESVVLEWDGKIDFSNLIEDVSKDLPLAINLPLTPVQILSNAEAVYRKPLVPYQSSIRLSRPDNIKFLKNVLKEEEIAYFRIDAHKWNYQENHSMGDFYSIIVLDKNINNPADFAFPNEGISPKYSGFETELKLEGKYLNEPLFLWIAKHHMDIANEEEVKKITEEILKLRDQS